ncbi:MAG: hypothetical protein IRZ32_18135 [Solirubrobacteraceae bacterium]|nr:hypothetical protein [Solirubrobacteraceae bacterium]
MPTAPAPATRAFRFAQFELPWAIGPADGRYLLRPHAGEAPSHVVVIATLGAPQRRLLRRRRARRVDPDPPPAPVLVTRATVIDAAALDGEREAARWLDGVDADRFAADALAVLNRVVGAHRIAAAEPGARDVTRAQALAVRVGYGYGEEVADGRHRAAVELPPAGPGRRSAALRAQERLAALLGGRDVAPAGEELAQRARVDLAAGRWRLAALGLAVALDAAVAELVPWQDRGDMAARIEELRGLRPQARAAADRALQGGLDDDEAATVDRVLGRVEAAMRARAALGHD